MKIDLYRVHRNERGRITRTEYICSTNQSKTCAEAVLQFRLGGSLGLPFGAEIKGRFA